MDGTIVVVIVLGIALVVAIMALIFYKTADKNDQPPSTSPRNPQYDKPAQSESEHLGELREKRRDYG